MSTTSAAPAATLTSPRTLRHYLKHLTLLADYSDSSDMHSTTAAFTLDPQHKQFILNKTIVDADIIGRIATSYQRILDSLRHPSLDQPAPWFDRDYGRLLRGLDEGQVTTESESMSEANLDSQSDSVSKPDSDSDWTDSS